MASADERRRRRGAALSIRKCREHSNRKGEFGVAPGSDRHSRRRTVTKHKYERSMRNSPVTESPRYRCGDRRIERSARGIASVRATLAMGSTGKPGRMSGTVDFADLSIEEYFALTRGGVKLNDRVAPKIATHFADTVDLENGQEVEDLGVDAFLEAVVESKAYRAPLPASIELSLRKWFESDISAAKSLIKNTSTPKKGEVTSIKTETADTRLAPRAAGTDRSDERSNFWGGRMFALPWYMCAFSIVTVALQTCSSTLLTTVNTQRRRRRRHSRSPSTGRSPVF